MKHLHPVDASRVKLLTLVIIITLSGCSYINSFYEETCNFRAYLRTPLADYLNRRYHTKAPVRMAIIPFSSQANVASHSNELPGLGNELAWKVKDEMLASGEMPIVEILNRQDWPGKKEEYFTGNFGAIAMGREAGYDLVLVGLVERMRGLDALTVQSKIIETRTGITIWNGKSTVHSDREGHDQATAGWWFSSRQPSKFHTNILIDEMALCITRSILEDEEVPS
ncbi:hypothetical protein OAO01_05415 [Oligoflexia bacterium]|nr:hypothetical protein [Oligoflexia bacterium]